MQKIVELFDQLQWIPYSIIDTAPPNNDKLFGGANDYMKITSELTISSAAFRILFIRCTHVI